ncbi:MAG: tRNA (N6-isopentenyl adenosine(37)-C2)-methylthiotransferase MiaB, partial [Duodenibacillus sp.]|nr:tRNA (N6-isopentenyl adenosine(37)-C2)-methylthiotransferase MiaB [Oscillospiraceae bacterium]MCF0253980.1 tRNA (N6-isopentenyl adenosine(37)-C2)-methylthiotransferase MiaB [Duodenibacillus sp.]
MPAKKLYLRSFGCQMNDYDSARLADLLKERRGYERTDALEEADLAVINTCSIREKAQEKTFSDLGRIREAKREFKPDMLIAVGGCVATQEGEEILRRAPWVNVVFGPQTMHRLPALLDAVACTGRPQVDVGFPGIEKFSNLPERSAPEPTAFVSIMEGCSKYCTYCIVPYTRGEELSRPVVDVLVECTELAEKGVKEITLLGQNVNAYMGEGPDGLKADLALLIDYINEIPGIERIRFMTSHPREFSDRLIEVYGRVPKLANHLHLPVQSGSDAILAAMKRGYTHDWYLERIEKLRRVRPDISVATDFIVGFPGETEHDFDETMRLIDEVKFDASFSFVYSRRPGTPAAALADDTPQSLKLERLQHLQAVIEADAQRISRGMLGKTERCLI